MSSVFFLPTAANEPVRQKPRRGRYPRNVVSFRKAVKGRRNRMRRVEAEDLAWREVTGAWSRSEFLRIFPIIVAIKHGETSTDPWFPIFAGLKPHELEPYGLAVDRFVRVLKEGGSLDD